MAASTRLDESLEKIGFILKLTGIFLEKQEEFTRKYKLLYIFNFVITNGVVLGAILWLIAGARRGESLASLTYIAPCIMLGCLSDIKSLCLIIYQDKVNELIKTLRKLENNLLLRKYSIKKDEIIKREITFLHLVLKVLISVNVVLLVAFPLMPITLMIATYVETKEINFMLPFPVEYPVNVYDVKLWPWVLVWQIWSEIVADLYILCADTFFFICSTHIRIQFHLLAFEVERLIPSSGSTHEIEDGTFETRFKDLVEWHQMLLHSVDLLEVIYCKSTLFNFVLSSVLICLTGFNVTVIDDKALVVSFISFLFMSLLQIYFLCFFGELLMISSVAVSHAIYNCRWYLVDRKAAAMLLVVQVRAQKASKLTAYGFADVNFKSFTKILSTAWSYFALLKTVNSSPRG